MSLMRCTQQITNWLSQPYITDAILLCCCSCGTKQEAGCNSPALGITQMSKVHGQPADASKSPYVGTQHT